MTASPLNILIAIVRRDRVGATELARFLSTEKSTLSRNLAVMKRRGWVRALAGPDGRSQTVEATAKGRALLDAALPAWRQAQRSALEILGAQGASVLGAAVDSYRPA